MICSGATTVQGPAPQMAPRKLTGGTYLHGGCRETDAHRGQGGLGCNQPPDAPGITVTYLEQEQLCLRRALSLQQKSHEADVHHPHTKGAQPSVTPNPSRQAVTQILSLYFPQFLVLTRHVLK